MDWHLIQEEQGVEILLVSSCYRNRDNSQPDEPLGLYADITFAKRTGLLFRNFEKNP